MQGVCNSSKEVGRSLQAVVPGLTQFIRLLWPFTDAAHEHEAVCVLPPWFFARLIVPLAAEDAFICT